MITNEFINKIVDENTTVVSAEELEEIEEETVLNPEYADGAAHSDASAVTLIEDLEYTGFKAEEIEALFNGTYLHDGGPWGMIPHIARLYTDDQRSYYILIMEVAG